MRNVRGCGIRDSPGHDDDPLRAVAVGPAASGPCLFARRSAIRLRGRPAGGSACGSRTSTPAAAGPSSSTASSRTCAGWASSGTAKCWSSRSGRELYAEALDRLRERGLVYACFCTRADIALSLTAPHGDAGSAYPGTCRGLPDDPERRATTPHSWRLDSRQGACARRDCRRGPRLTAKRSQRAHGDIGDAILARKDAPSSYHLACVVDDAASGVDAGRARRGFAAVDAGPAAAAVAARPARAELSAPSAGAARRRPAAGQARPRADAGRHARGGRRRTGAGAPGLSPASFRLVSLSRRARGAP